MIGLGAASTSECSKPEKQSDNPNTAQAIQFTVVSYFSELISINDICNNKYRIIAFFKSTPQIPT